MQDIEVSQLPSAPGSVIDPLLVRLEEVSKTISTAILRSGFSVADIDTLNDLGTQMEIYRRVLLDCAAAEQNAPLLIAEVSPLVSQFCEMVEGELNLSMLEEVK
ncbi:hypothetical protein ACIPLR_17755 [Herbaspirillum huttiense]|jgi:hypothetical protein|uniref:hypothetical protein n=1 Tax=Herbaspirillum huttiense TaxID=863372 RepID=UPI0037F62CE6